MSRKEYHRQLYLKNKEKILERQATPEYREKQNHYQRLKRERLREETQKENLIFIEENGLVEHPDYPGYYGTIDGKVFSNRGAYGKIRPVKPILQKLSGYYLLSLGWKDKSSRNQCLHHRFISQLFVSNPNNYNEVNHIDEDKSNNNADNLEWCDRQYNQEHSLAKNYKITNLKTGESFIIKNLARWCREESIDVSQAREVAYGRNNRKTLKQKTFTVECEFK
ncbi:HNH endonuclease [bacterium]|nr:HNH endonuclease [bacterium]|tara:strand:+ start:87 stop:755 length:669 start_codon:yes stop_codon:yes gene_type:complete